jgi:adenine phosphoribosyltransferase
MQLEGYIRDVPDFPKKGIIFKDITTLLKEKDAFKYVIETMSDKYLERDVSQIVGIESRGFIFAGAMAYRLGCGFVPARKPEKLPAEKIREEYTLEYGTNALEIHRDAIKPGESVVIADDLLATGGTALAVAKMVEKLEGRILGIEFLIELDFLKGREKIKQYEVFSYLHF